MYCLIRDDDSHWYVIPADKRLETWAYFEAIYKYWETGNYDGEPPEEPEWLEPINTSPCYVIFPSWTMG